MLKHVCRFVRIAIGNLVLVCTFSRDNNSPNHSDRYIKSPNHSDIYIYSPNQLMLSSMNSSSLVTMCCMD